MPMTTATGADRAPRQLLIGIDAMEWTLVRKWAGEGALPALRRMIDEGVVAQLTSSAHALPDMSWTTFSLGMNPGEIETSTSRTTPGTGACAMPMTTRSAVRLSGMTWRAQVE